MQTDLCDKLKLSITAPGVYRHYIPDIKDLNLNLIHDDHFTFTLMSQYVAVQYHPLGGENNPGSMQYSWIPSKQTLSGPSRSNLMRWT